jgi:hypothetical protein
MVLKLVLVRDAARVALGSMPRVDAIVFVSICMGER